MRTGKIIFAIFLGLLIGQWSFAQSGNTFRTESAIPYKTDPIRAVQLFPNPATDYLSLKFEHPQARKIKLTVYTIIGNAVDVESEVLDDFELRIRVRDLNSGYYLLAIHNQDSGYKNTLKFLKR